MKKSRRIFAVALALMLLLSSMSFVGAAEAETATTSGRVIEGYDPIPLLVIKINCDTDGDGKDCYEYINENGERPYVGERYLADLGIKESVYRGEQYCYSPDEYWANLCFGEDFGSLNHYYKYISNDRFYWIPAEETSGTANDGVITVTVNAPHPGSKDGGDLGDGDERGKALAAADEFVDFSKFDKNGDGQIEFTELSVVFIYGGVEISYNASKGGTQYVYPTHAHVAHMSYVNEKDGVKLWGDLPYVRMGEYSGGGSNRWSKMGKLAHELGHVLGAKDLYINSTDWIGGCGQLSLMGGGSGGSNNGVSSPTVLDPYYKVLYGFADETIAKYSETGIEYTLYSHESTEGEFNVIRVNLPNSNEYLLLENRSHSKSGYDNNDLNDINTDDSICEGSMQGILIWHIDESIINSTSRPNNGNEGHAPGFTVITPNNGTYDEDANSTWSKDSVSNVFYASNDAPYTFMVSTPNNKGSWHTSLTAEQAAECNIKIEFLTSAGNEMTVRITGACDLPPVVAGSAAKATQSSLSLKAGVTDFNGAEILSCKMKISEKSDLSDATEITVEKNADCEYIGVFEGLKADTEYYYAISMETTHGTVEKTSSTYTLPKPVEKTKASVTVFLNSDRGTKITVKTDVGKTVAIGDAYLVKKGYTFDGWYLDEAFTQPYDITKPIESTDDFAIYAKWTENAPENTTTGNVTPGGDDVQNGGNGDNGGNGGNTTTIVIIAVAAVVVVGGCAAAAVVIVNKKKTK